MNYLSTSDSDVSISAMDDQNVIWFHWFQRWMIPPPPHAIEHDFTLRTHAAASNQFARMNQNFVFFFHNKLNPPKLCIISRQRSICRLMSHFITVHLANNPLIWLLGVIPIRWTCNCELLQIIRHLRKLDIQTNHFRFNLSDESSSSSVKWNHWHVHIVLFHPLT